jgi:uncharacterized membrane protein
MDIRQFLRVYLVAFFWFIVVDGVWLAFIATDFYRTQLSELLTDSVNWSAAVLFYLLYVGGLGYFVINDESERTVRVKTLRGAFFGFICYATYDLTNLATLEGWPVVVTVVDLIWSLILSGSITWLSLKTLSLLKKRP